MKESLNSCFSIQAFPFISSSIWRPVDYENHPFL